MLQVTCKIDFYDKSHLKKLNLTFKTKELKKLDWYIFKKFITTFLFSVILFTLISTVIDMSEHMDDFTRSHLDYGTIALQYYAGFVPFIVSMLFPLFVFLSVIFFTSKMADRAEFIAILASGVSLRRILRPYWIGGILLALTLYIANYQLIPRANEKRTKFEAKYIRSPMTEAISGSWYMRVDSFSYCGIRYYDTTTKTGSTFFMETIRDHKVTYNMRADNISWDTSKRKWKLTGVVERKIAPLKEQVQYHTELYRSFTFTPSDLQRDEYVKSRLTTPELNRMIKLEKLRGSETVKELEMEGARRAATPISVIILTLIGAILACRKIRGGSGVHLAVGIILCAIFILTDRFSTIFSTKGNLNPYVAAWIPNILFAFITLRLYKKAPK
jgi:lipopolysaccharide export system permease protein